MIVNIKLIGHRCYSAFISSSRGGLSEAVPGRPGEDFPVLSTVPATTFTCTTRQDGGFYADTEAECQVESVDLGMMFD